jgi:Flp pilus assembly protein TadG
MIKIRELGKAFGETRGTEIAEAALVLPIMFMVLLGIYYFGLALSTYETINHAAMEAARIAALPTCATCARSVNTTLAGDAVQHVLQAAGLNPAKSAEIPGETLTSCGNSPPTCNDPSSGGGPSLCVYYDVLLNLTSPTGPQSCGVYVSLQYPYQFYLPFTSLNLQQLQLKARVQYPGEY